jgi:hypothetical protein
MFSILTLISLLVGTFMYWNEFSAKQLATYWSVFLGSALFFIAALGSLVILIQIVTVACFFAHARLKAGGHG